MLINKYFCIFLVIFNRFDMVVSPFCQDITSGSHKITVIIRGAQNCFSPASDIPVFSNSLLPKNI